mgnify:CR=1 FL=1
MGSDFFLNDERYFFLHDHGNLNLNGFYFSLMDLNGLIFNSISIGFNWNFFDDFEGDPFLEVNLNWFLFCDFDFD